MTKYTDEQIKVTEIPEAKSLRWLAVIFPKIEKPKDDAERMQNCIHNYCSNAANLIDRQEAEIERLKDYNENLQTANTALSNEILDIKSEAIKEFAERLLSTSGYENVKPFVKDLVKEMCKDRKEKKV